MLWEEAAQPPPRTKYLTVGPLPCPALPGWGSCIKPDVSKTRESEQAGVKETHIETETESDQETTQEVSSSKSQESRPLTLLP